MIDFDRILESYMNYVSDMDSNSSISEINRIRRRIRDEAIETAGNAGCGIYSFKLPTSSGKTLTTLGAALHHVKSNGLRRIVYVSPFLSILDQTVAVYRDVFGSISDRVICEDHSNYHGSINGHRLECDRWDKPIVMTTAVNLIDTFYSANGTELRKLHNMANTLFILDEIQQIDVCHWATLNETLNFLCSHLGCVVYACTATLPLMDNPKLTHRLMLEDTPMVTVSKEELEVFKTRYVLKDMTRNSIGLAGVVEMINENMKRINTFLVVTNTKRESRELYDLLMDNNDSKAEILLLNTNFHKKDRLKKISHINEATRSLDGRKLVCISTNMIEAGVDVSFQSGIRYAGGEDNVLQVAGRINRHGTFRKDDSILYVIDFEDESFGPLENIRDAKSAYLQNRNSGVDLNSDESLECFYRIRELGFGINETSKIRKTNIRSEYPMDDYMDTKSKRNNTAYGRLARGCFSTVSEKVRVISENNETVIINQDKFTDDLIGTYVEIASSPDPNGVALMAIMKQLTDYSVSVVGHLDEIGNLCRMISDGVWVLDDFGKIRYDENSGLTLT